MDDLEFDEKSVVDTPLIEFNNDDMNELELDDNLLDEIDEEVRRFKQRDKIFSFKKMLSQEKITIYLIVLVIVITIVMLLISFIVFCTEDSGCWL